VGGNQTIHSDVRIISATNRDLESKVKEGTFREDLFYRLNVVVVDMPPLRERKEDVPLLIDHFLKRFAAENGKNVTGITSEARDLLLKYDYPGNVRELENIIERAVVISRNSVISVDDLPFDEDRIYPEDAGKKGEGLLRGSVEEMERKLILEAMEKSGDHQTKAAEILGISERMLRYKLKKYGLKE
jgi:transcriptional regulator with PAS, ATPase and Fis domain